MKRKTDGIVVAFVQYRLIIILQCASLTVPLAGWGGPSWWCFGVPTYQKRSLFIYLLCIFHLHHEDLPDFARGTVLQAAIDVPVATRALQSLGHGTPVVVALHKDNSNGIGVLHDIGELGWICQYIYIYIYIRNVAEEVRKKLCVGLRDRIAHWNSQPAANPCTSTTEILPIMRLSDDAFC